MKKMHKRAMALCLTAALCSGLFCRLWGGEKNTAETQQATEHRQQMCRQNHRIFMSKRLMESTDDFIRAWMLRRYSHWKTVA